MTENDNVAMEFVRKQLQGYKTGKRLQQASIQYIVEHLATPEELDELHKAFDAINISRNGQITIEELSEAFNAYTVEEQAEIKKIFEEVDLDNSGSIEFSEWIVASIDKRSLISEEKLKLAFRLFD